MKNRTKSIVVLLSVAATSIALGAGCGPSVVMKVQKAKATQPRTAARWVVLPFANHSDTPQAGDRVEALVATILRSHGVAEVAGYPVPKTEEVLTLTSDHARVEEALAWARGAKFDYGVTGSVEEWRYKSGLEAEPAVGVTVRVIELSSGKVVWSASGTKTGKGADNASGTALTLVDALVENLDFAL